MQLSKVGSFFGRLHKDEQGDIPVGPLLIIGVIAIPLVIALITFGDAIITWLREKWATVTGAQQVAPFGGG